MEVRGFTQIGGPVLEVLPVIKIIVYLGLFWGPLFVQTSMYGYASGTGKKDGQLGKLPFL